MEVKQIDCYFQYEYVNYAWGFNHRGFTITPAGEVYLFDKTTPWIFAENNELPFSTLLKNISASVKKDTLISQKDMELLQQYAAYASVGKMSTPVVQGADIGALVCKIIVPDPTNPPNNYREVILTQTGDVETHNLSADASVIADWLSKLR